MQTISQFEVNALARDAEKLPRQRLNRNLHEDASDHIQRMLNSLSTEAYVQPHRHKEPGKRETLVLLQGQLLVIEFDNLGHIVQHALMTAQENVVVEIDAGRWHTVIALQPQTVVFEMKDGPYDPTADKELAPWAPAEDNPAYRTYRDSLLRDLGYFSFVFQQEYAFG